MTLALPPPVADKLESAVEEAAPAGDGVGERPHEDAAAVTPAE